VDGTRFELVTSSVSGRPASCLGESLNARESTSPGRMLPTVPGDASRTAENSSRQWLPLRSPRCPATGSAPGPVTGAPLWPRNHLPRRVWQLLRAGRAEVTGCRRPPRSSPGSRDPAAWPAASSAPAARSPLTRYSPGDPRQPLALFVTRTRNRPSQRASLDDQHSRKSSAGNVTGHGSSSSSRSRRKRRSGSVWASSSARW